MNRIKKIAMNPVFGKETKLRVRNIKFALIILFYNLILIAIAMLGFEMMFDSGFDTYVDYSDALYVYIALLCLQSMMVAFLVPSFTAGSIAGEREKQTLEILLTTTMKPIEIVWGKLMASICMVLLLVMSSLPVLSIVFTIGGVALVDLLYYVVLVFVAAVFMGSIGVWASALIKKTVPATVFSYGAIVMVCGVTMLMVGLVYLIANLVSANIHGTMYGTQNVDVSPILVILLINPAVSLVEMLMDRYAGQSFISLMNESLGGSLPGFLEKHWFVFSLIVQIGLSILIMKMAAKLVDPLRTTKPKKVKQKKTQQVMPPQAGQ